MRSLRARVGLLMFGAGMIAALTTATAPSPAAALGPLPACRLDDVLTVPRDYDSWSTTLVDWILSVGEDYAPPDLVSVNDAGLAGGGSVRAVALDDTRAMAAAAAANGTPIGSWSAYRGYSQQVELFNGYVNAYGYDNTIQFSHRPGHSEHQLGLGIDFMSAGGGSPMEGDWARTPAGSWMKSHAWEYGWVMSYPLLDPSQLWQETVCFRYEPWHYRYLGREVAAQIHASGLTIREYLWANYTRVDPTTGKPIPAGTVPPAFTGVPKATPEPTPTPTPPPLPTPSPSTATPSPGRDDGGPIAIGGIGPLLVAGVVLVVTLGYIVLRRSTRTSSGR